MFFALSGFLIASSLARSASLTQFIIFRAVRLLPALTVVVVISMLLLGPLLTSESGSDYFTSGHFISYLGNIAGRAQYGLPGVFLHNPRPGIVNGSLWTIPVELWCYLGVIPVYVFGVVYRPAMLTLAVATLLLTLTAGFYWGKEWAAILPTGELVLPFLAGVGIFAAPERIPSHPALGIVLFAIAVVLTSHARWGITASLPLAYATIWIGMRELPKISGDYSYGLYLVGYPLQQAFVALFPGHPWYQTWSVCLPAALVFAMLLWHFVERPVLSQKYRLIISLSFLAQLRRLGTVKATAPGYFSFSRHAAVGSICRQVGANSLSSLPEGGP
jgi:peptidoglycan/LPS O-acetylase OafA/YrhL